MITEKEKACYLFNNYFVNVANDFAEDSAVNMLGPIEKIIKVYDNHSSVNLIKQNKCERHLFNIKTVDRQDVYDKLKNVKVKKSPAYDNIPAKLIKVG